MSTKAAPPFEPVRYGNFQMLPRPMAEPTVAVKAPSVEAKLSRAEADGAGMLRSSASGRMRGV